MPPTSLLVLLPSPPSPPRFRIATVAFSQNNTMRAFVDAGFFVIDTMIGYVMFIMISILSFIGIVHILQMKLLFNDTFAQVCPAATTHACALLPPRTHVL